MTTKTRSELAHEFLVAALHGGSVVSAEEIPVVSANSPHRTDGSCETFKFAGAGRGDE